MAAEAQHVSPRINAPIARIAVQHIAKPLHVAIVGREIDRQEYQQAYAQLQALVKRAGITNVVCLLAEVCYGRADATRARDVTGAERWDN